MSAKLKSQGKGEVFSPHRKDGKYTAVICYPFGRKKVLKNCKQNDKIMKCVCSSFSHDFIPDHPPVNPVSLLFDVAALLTNHILVYSAVFSFLLSTLAHSLPAGVSGSLISALVMLLALLSLCLSVTSLSLTYARKNQATVNLMAWILG